MKDYIASLLPRLKQLSKSLNDTALLADHPWVFIDDDGKKLTHIFRRDGQLLVSAQGEVIKGKWEYLPTINSLLIEYGDRSWLYKQGFVDPAILVMQKDGAEDLFVLVNQNMIPDLDVVSYLTQRVVLQTPQNMAALKDGSLAVKVKNKQLILKIEDCSDISLSKGKAVSILDGTSVPDGIFLTQGGLSLAIKSGKVKNIINWEISALKLALYLLCIFAIIYTLDLLFNK